MSVEMPSFSDVKIKPGFRAKRGRWNLFKKLAQAEHLRSGNQALELLMEHALEMGRINRPKRKKFPVSDDQDDDETFRSVREKKKSP